MAQRGSGSLFIGLLGSAALHAGLALAVLLSPSSVGPADPADPGQSVLLLPPPPPEPPPPPLGLPDESATGKAWLGVLDPTPHAAPAPGQSEQAALSPRPADAEPPSAEAGTPGLTASAEHRDAVAEPNQAPASMVPAPRPAPPPSEAVDAPSTEPLILEVSRPDDVPAQAEPAAAEPVSDSETSPPALPTQSAIEPAVPSPGTDERPGLLDPRESDAVSATLIPDAVPGRPLAAHGLRITTVRPRWPISTRLTRDPANPTVRVSFSRAGRVINVEFVRPTGFEDVDEPLRTALYKWTATGAPLAALPPHADPAQPEPGLTITFRVVLQ
ncbi:MAG: hypothetical protein FJ255_11920 [Phycisphaerae bacterium]|nr:hypothetical protein [Phycisphaerae bacterium]